MADVLTVSVPARAATSKLSSVLAKAVTAVTAAVSACRRATERVIRDDGVYERMQQTKDRYALEASRYLAS